MRKIITIFFVLLSCTLPGQDKFNLDLKFYDKSTGLQSQRIISIAQDTSGRLFMATETGITTYNGFTFEQILDFDSLSFYANDIHISNDNSLYLMQTELFIPVSGAKKNLLNIEKVSLEDLKVKSLGVELGKGLSMEKLNPNLIRITNEKNKSWIIDSTIHIQYNNLPYNFISKDRKVFGKIKANSFSLEDENGQFIHVPEDIVYLLDNDVSTKGDLHFLLMRNEGKNVYTGLYDLKNNNLSIVSDLPENAFVRPNLLMDKNDFIWTLGNFFIHVYDMQQHKFQNVQNIIENRWGKIRFYCHFKDHQENIWIGTSAGLILAKSEKSKFHSFWQNENVSSRGMHYWKDNKLLVLTYSGIKTIDINTLESNSLNGEEQRRPGQTNIKKIENEFVVTTKSHEINVYNTQDFEAKERVLIDSSLFQTFEYNHPILVKNHCYIFNKLGLYKYHNGKIEKDTLHNEIDLSTLVKVNQYHDEIYLSTKDKVYIMDDFFNLKDKFELDANFSFCTKDRQGNYWLASKKGLIKWNLKENTHKIYSERDGLYYNDITALIIDEYNFLWIATYQGLYRFDIEKEIFSLFTSFDGLPNDEFNHHSNLVLPDGRIVLGTIDGVCIFNPKDFIERNQKTENKVRIQKIIEQNKDGKITESKPQEIIQFKSSDLEKRLTLWQSDFNNLSYRKFQYKLINHQDSSLNSNWIVLNSNEIALGKKPYGEYDLLMQSINTKDGSSSPIYTHQINYVKPFQYSWWFICNCLLLMGLMIWSYIKLRIRYLSRQNLQLEALVSERTNDLKKSNDTKNKLFAILAHDIRNPLAAFSNLSMKIAYLAERNEIDKIIDLSSNVDQKISGLSKMLDNVLYWALTEKGNITVNSEAVDMHDMVLEILILYQEMIEEKNVSIVNEIPIGYEIQADKAMMNIVFRNLLDNAIKFVNRGGTIAIRREVSSKYFKIAVLNTGTSIKTSTAKLLTENTTNPVNQRLSKRSSGLGLTVCKELLALNNGELQLKSLKEAGTYAAMLIKKIDQNI